MRWISLERLRVYAREPRQLASAAIFRPQRPQCVCRCITDPAEWCPICNPRSSVPCAAQVMCPHWERFGSVSGTWRKSCGRRYLKVQRCG